MFDDFVAKIVNGMVIWTSTGITCGSQVKYILEICHQFNRSVVVNTGGHGSTDGSGPTNFRNGDGRCISEDMTSVVEAKGKDGIHVVSQDSIPIFPAKTDAILAWCHSE